jgi:hypothetical protein
MLFIEEFEKAFGKPKIDGVRGEVLVWGFRIGPGPFTEENYRSVFADLANGIRRKAPHADIEFLSLEVKSATDKSGALTPDFKIEFLTDSATRTALHPN